jgi:Mg2+ and Co2+ transporter CorA
MDIVLQNLLRRFWGEVLPLLDWAMTNWALTIVGLAIALACSSFYRWKFHK